MEKVASSSSIPLAGGRAVAAKTGTVGVANGPNSSDAWTVGFTPQVSVASWAGSNTQSPIYNNQGTSMYGRQNPGQAWQLFMNAYLANAPKAAMPTKQEVGGAAAVLDARRRARPTRVQRPSDADADRRRTPTDGTADEPDQLRRRPPRRRPPADGDHRRRPHWRTRRRRDVQGVASAAHLGGRARIRR